MGQHFACGSHRIEACLAKVRFTEVHPAEVRLAESWHYLWLLFSPLIPLLYPLLESSKMFCVCHLTPLLPENISPMSEYGKTVFILSVSGFCTAN